MALHPEFPLSPYVVAEHDQRWFPADEALRTTAYERLLPQWCTEATTASQAAGGPAYRHLFVDQEGFEGHRPTNLQGLVATFREYQE